MALQIRGNGITVSDDVRDFAEQKVGRLDRFVPKVDERKLELRHNHAKSGPDTVTAQVTLQSGRTLLRAEVATPTSSSPSIARSISCSVRSARSTPSVPSALASASRSGWPRWWRQRWRPAEAAVPEEIDEPEEDLGAIVRTKRFALKPMDVDEAIERMELLGHDFFLFQNADEHTFCVVYRRKGGDYGLLVPDRG
jgi:putative sigma-54 modulation protein